MKNRMRFCFFTLALASSSALQAQLDTHTGVGIVFSIDSSRGYKVPIVNAVVPDAPADAAGLRAGDMVMAVNGVSVKNKTWEEDTKLIGGEAGTKVTLDIEANGAKQSFTITRQKYEYANAYYNNENPADAFCVAVNKLLNDAAYQFKHCRGMVTNVDSSSGNHSVTYYKCYVNIPDAVKTEIFYENLNTATEALLASVSTMEAATKKSDEYIQKLKSCFPAYYYDKIKNEKELPYTIIGKTYSDGYETPAAYLQLRKSRAGYDIILRIPGGDKHRVTNIETAPVDNNFAKAVNKIINDVPNKFESVKGTRHEPAKDDVYGAPWYELNVTPEGAKECKFDTRLFGTGCGCAYYQGTSAEEAKEIFNSISAKVKSALGKPYSYDTQKPQLSLTVPSSAVRVMNFGKKTKKETEQTAKLTLFMNKDIEGKYNVKMVVESDGM